MTKDYNSSTPDIEKLKKANLIITVILNSLILIFYVMEYRIQLLNNSLDHSMYHFNFPFNWMNNCYNFLTKMFCCLQWYDCSKTCLNGCRKKPGKYATRWFICPRKHEIWYFFTFIFPLFLEVFVVNGVFFPNFIKAPEGQFSVNQTSSQQYNYTYQIDFLEDLSEMLDVDDLIEDDVKS